MGKLADDVQEMYMILPTLVLQPVEIIGSIVILMTILHEAALGALALLIFMLVLAHFVGGQIEDRMRAYESNSNRFVTALSETVSGMMTIRLAGWTPAFLQRLRGLQKRTLDCNKTAVRTAFF